MLITEKNVQNLALQLINDCPINQSGQFEDGFSDFVEYFFVGLESITNVLYLPQDGGAEVDIDYEFDETLAYLERNFKGSSVDYWQGVDLAASMSYQMLNFAFEMRPANKAA